MSNEQMTDALALEMIDRHIDGRDFNSGLRKARDHIAARLRGEAAQGGDGINVPAALALIDAVGPGYRVIYRSAFRWLDERGIVISNHYESQDAPQLAEDHGHELIADLGYAAILRDRRPDTAQGEQQAVACIGIPAGPGTPSLRMLTIDLPPGQHKVYTRPQPAAVAGDAVKGSCTECAYAGSMDGRTKCPLCGLSAAPAAPEDPLPEPGPTQPNTTQGLYRKFDVRRTDGSDAPGGKHDGCDYFVLDMTHDPFAAAAAAAYATAAESAYPRLASDMRTRYRLTAAPAPVAGDAVAKLPPLPQAFFDEFGICADDRVQDYAYAALAQDRASRAGVVPDAVREAIDYTLSRSNMPYAVRTKMEAARAALAAQPSGGGVPEAVQTAMEWLRSALDCAEFIWEEDQAKDAEAAYAAAILALDAAPAAPETGGEVG